MKITWIFKLSLILSLISFFGCAEENAQPRGKSPAADVDKDDDVEVEKDSNEKDQEDGKKEDTKKDKGGKLDTAEGEVEVEGPSNIQEQKTTVGFRNFSQMNFTMAALTGIDPHNNAAVRTAYDELRGQLPGNNNIREVTPAKVAAVNKLGGTYCDELMKNATQRSALFPAINFTATPSVAFANPDAFAGMLIETFWQEDADSNANKDNKKILSDLIAQMVVGREGDAAQTPNIAMGACTAAISSAPVTAY